MATTTLLEISCHGSYMLDSSVTISAFIHKLRKWAHLYCWQFNQLVTNGLSHPYHLDKSTFILSAVGVTSFLFCILLHIHRQWDRTVYHGGDTDVPGLRRYRPDAVPVETRLLPAYSGIHGIWQPSRLLPVSPGCFKHFKTAGDMSRFNTVQHGSSRIAKVVHGTATVVTRFITVHPGSSNRDEPAP